MAHLELEATVQSCFVNRNSKDFDDPDIIEKLESKNCKMLFSFERGSEYVSGLLKI